MAEIGDPAVVVAKDSIFPDTAVDADLDRLGSQFLIQRPRQLGLDIEERYRRLVQLLAFQPKMINKIVYQLLEILFGEQAAIIASGKREWRVYEVLANEIVVEIPHELRPGSIESATYLFPSATAFPGDYFLGGAQETVSYLTAAVVATGTTVALAHAAAFRPGDGVLFDKNDPTKDEYNTILSILGTIATLKDPLAFDHTINSPIERVVAGTNVNNQVIVLYSDGLVDIFREYMLKLVKAAGVKLRIERV